MAEDSTKPITPTPDDEVRRVLSLAHARRMETDMAEDEPKRHRWSAAPSHCLEGSETK